AVAAGPLRRDAPAEVGTPPLDGVAGEHRLDGRTQRRGQADVAGAHAGALAGGAGGGGGGGGGWAGPRGPGGGGRGRARGGRGRRGATRRPTTSRRANWRSGSGRISRSTPARCRRRCATPGRVRAETCRE